MGKPSTSYLQMVSAFYLYYLTNNYRSAVRVRPGKRIFPGQRRPPIIIGASDHRPGGDKQGNPCGVSSWMHGGLPPLGGREPDGTPKALHCKKDLEFDEALRLIPTIQ